MASNGGTEFRALDLFAGAGGWDEGILPLGITPLGIELDEQACATREAAGHPTHRADVAALDPRDFAPCNLLIASPPCQAFSAAGKRGGQKDVPLIHIVAEGFRDGRDYRGSYLGQLADERSLLVIEPLRWALELRPTFIALEQVPPVLPLWQQFARILESVGYHVWAGLLSAERYGVPQTRERAFLMASLLGPVHPPHPTHQEYRPGEPAAEQHTFEGTLLPWVSMAEALGWAGSIQTGNFTAKHKRGERGRQYERETEAPAPTVDTSGRWGRVDVPAPTVTAGGTENGGPEPFGRGGRRRIAQAARIASCEDEA